MADPAARRRVVCVIGTRPEAIKMAPVIAALRASTWATCRVVATAQHRGLLDQALDPFGIVPDVDLDLMTEGQGMPELTGRMVPALSAALSPMRPDAVLAQGDTATVFCAALAAFYARVPFGHVEAGLRTNDLAQPFPEEGFRQMVARIARWHFAPTSGAARNLAGEGVPQAHVHVTGNTGIDALLSILATTPRPARIPGETRILLTAHRRESFGAPLEAVFRAVRALADDRGDLRFAYPVHPNPHVSGPALALLGNHPRIALLPPLGYADFTRRMAASDILLTDSGGIQEEAPALGIPVLVLRERTERPEAVACGAARLVGTDPVRIREEVLRLLEDGDHYRAMATGGSPYGDGHAAGRIEAILAVDMAAIRAS
jgi:UDP-N-acetylglucosamine 2-epimerase (non-hydrolysing)